MNRDILVWASKQVGAETLDFLLKTGAPVGRIIAGEWNDQNILALAERHGVPAEIHNNETQERLIVEGQRWAWMMSLWNPHLLKPAVLRLADRTLNLHPALLPYCRGNDCAAWALRLRAPAGVSILSMDSGVDTGSLWVQREVLYDFPTRGGELQQVLQRELIDLFKQAWPEISAGSLLPKKQVGEGFAHTRRQTNADRFRNIDNDATTRDVLGWMLAHDFSPGTTAEIEHNGRRYKIALSIEEVR
jgi:methionyl-tRNA formyltransferase